MQDTADTAPTSPPLHSQLTLFSKTTRFTYVTSFPGGMRNARRIANKWSWETNHFRTFWLMKPCAPIQFVRACGHEKLRLLTVIRRLTYREYVMLTERCSLSSIRWSNRNTFSHGCNWQQSQVREVVSTAFDNNSYDRQICHIPRQRTFGNGVLRNTYKLLEF